MTHWVIVPILLPLVTTILLLAGQGLGLRYTRALGLIATLALLPVSLHLMNLSLDGSYHRYALGDWPPPFGIVLVLDRLSALMLLLTAVLAIFSLLYALAGTDTRGKVFHPLFQVQLMGLNGAFLTGDLFNLFVFFEILLLASYGLLLHGGGGKRSRAGVHYVVLNLVGSALFLIALALIYGTAGTLNLADLAQRVASASPEQVPVLRTAALLLFTVFSLKAALVPVYFWLPASYSAASAPVAALFAIMTKVGVYAILRIFTVAFGPQATAVGDVTASWLVPLALITLVIGTLGALASTRFRTMLAYMVVASVGSLLIPIGVFSEAAIAAALYYLAHSTLVAGGMFLLADLLATRRGAMEDRLEPGPSLTSFLMLRFLFVLGAMAAMGLPPLSGYVGKMLTLMATVDHALAVWIWGVVLVSSLLIIIAVSRAGSVLFWKTGSEELQVAPARLPSFAILGLLATSPALAMLAGPVYEVTAATAEQLLTPGAYINGVLGGPLAATAGGQTP